MLISFDNITGIGKAFFRRDDWNLNQGPWELFLKWKNKSSLRPGLEMEYISIRGSGKINGVSAI